VSDGAWPVSLAGVTETVVTTAGPDGRWNVAALGVEAPADDQPATARTWGQTRTRQNFTERGSSYVHFVTDPLVFVEAALGTRTEADPILAAADAWAEVTVEQLDAGVDQGTSWADWALRPVESTVECERVPTINRGVNAVVEATVAASRLDVDAYDTGTLQQRLRHYEGVVDRCGSAETQEAFERLTALVDGQW
jgi:hypothetical protein